MVYSALMCFSLFHASEATCAKSCHREELSVNASGNRNSLTDKRGQDLRLSALVENTPLSLFA
jgi:hypothetical protein